MHIVSSTADHTLSLCKPLIAASVLALSPPELVIVLLLQQPEELSATFLKYTVCKPNKGLFTPAAEWEHEQNPRFSHTAQICAVSCRLMSAALILHGTCMHLENACAFAPAKMHVTAVPCGLLWLD